MLSDSCQCAEYMMFLVDLWYLVDNLYFVFNKPVLFCALFLSSVSRALL